MISQYCEISSSADMGIHFWHFNTIRFVLGDNSIIRNNSALEAKEGSIPIDNHIITLSSADDISTTTEPSKLRFMIGLGIKIAACITIGAMYIK